MHIISEPLTDVHRVRLDSSLADPSVAELLTNLDEQISDESSALRTGNVTSAAMGLAYTTSIVAESTSTDLSTAVGVSVAEYQPKGLFGFTLVLWYTTEASGVATLTIERDHGVKGIMDIGYSTSDGSATGGEDYMSIASTVRFYDGDTSKSVHVLLVDDIEKEVHFEFFTVTLSLEGPVNAGAALKTTASEATVLLYDYGDGVILADAMFTAEANSSTTGASGAEDLALGWAISDNGGHNGWVDSNGFAAKDAVFGADEYGRSHGHDMAGQEYQVWRSMLATKSLGHIHLVRFPVIAPRLSATEGLRSFYEMNPLCSFHQTERATKHSSPPLVNASAWIPLVFGGVCR